MSQSAGQARAIDPKVRAAALEAARRYGTPLGGWLSHALAQGDGAEAPPADPETSLEAALGVDQTRRIAEALERLAQRVEFNERRSSLLIGDVDRVVGDLTVRLQETELGAREQSLRVIAALGEVKSLTAALSERLSQLEQEPSAERALGALKELDRRVGQMLRESAEANAEADRRGDALEARLTAALSDMRRTVSSVETRLGAAEAALAQARAAASEAVAPVATRLEGLERTTRAAIGQLESRVAEIDDEIAHAFATLGVSVDRALKRAGVAAGGEIATREDLARAVEALERRFAQTAPDAHSVAELRQALAVLQERIGRLEGERASALAAMEARLEAAEQRTLATAETVSAEFKRLSATVDQGVAALQAAASGDEALTRLAQVEAKAEELQRDFATRLAALETRAGARINDGITRLAHRLSESESRAEALSHDVASRLAQAEARAEEAHAELRRELDEATRRTLEVKALIEAMEARAAAPMAAPEADPIAFERIEPGTDGEPQAHSPPEAAMPWDEARDETDRPAGPRVHAHADFDAAAAEAFWSLEPPAEAKPTDEARSGSYLDQARRAAQKAANATGSQAKRRQPAHPGRGGGAMAAMIGAGAAAALAGGVWFVLRDAEFGPPPAPNDSPAPQTPVSPQLSLQAAAENGDATAQYEVAMARLAQGDAASAVAMLRRAAGQGLAVAQFELGRLYERGQGVEADTAAARGWMERAAAGGNRQAMHVLGVYFAKGEGAALDEAAAFRWFRQAAELGVVDSQFNLGVMYQQGRGAPADAEEALFWFLIASAGGDAQATQVAQRLGEDLGPETLAHVQARAERFTPKPMNPVANGEFGPRPWAPAPPRRAGPAPAPQAEPQPPPPL